MPAVDEPGGLIARADVSGHRVLTGFRPTGKLHIGHLLGNIGNLVDLQARTEVYAFVADWHMLSTDFDRAESLPQNTFDLVADLVGAGIDPERTVLYRQSDLAEVAELNLYFSMITPISWLERNPTYKEQLENLDGREISTHGFLGYPVLQIADIVIVKGEVVPVGEDQLPHLEIGREIVRRFHHLFGGPLFPEPLGLLSHGARVPGTDGRKMSKSYGNAVFLSDTAVTVDEKIRAYVTDPKKVRLRDPGHPEVCDVFALHRLCTPESTLPLIESECRAGDRGCVACKAELASGLNLILDPIRERRADLEAEPERVAEILERGFERVKPLVAETIAATRSLVGVGSARGAESGSGTGQ